MPEKAKESVESSIAELRKVAAKRLILVVLDGVFSTLLTCAAISCPTFVFHRHVGRRARTAVLVHRPSHSLEASGGAYDREKLVVACVQCFVFAFRLHVSRASSQRD